MLGYLAYFNGSADDDASFTCPNADWIGASTFLVHWDGTEWQFVPSEDPLTHWMLELPPGAGPARWTSPAGQLFAAGYDVSRPPMPGGPDFLLQDRIVEWDGEHWTTALVGKKSKAYSSTMYGGQFWNAAMWGDFGEDGWAILAGTYHWDGVSWTELSEGPDHVDCIWGTGPADVWASYYDKGDPQAVWHWDGSSWTSVDVPFYLACGTGGWAQDTRGGLWRRDLR
jgi:hypothetical protein